MIDFGKMFKYELKMTFREKEAIFWSFLFPIFLILILGFVFGSSANIKLSVGVVDLDDSKASRAVVEAISGIEAFEIKQGSEEEERHELRNDKRTAVLIIEKGFEGLIETGMPGTITMIVNKSDINISQIATSTITGVLEKISQELSDSPEIISINEVADEDVKDFEYVDFMIPGVLAITIMFGGIMGFSEQVAIRREKGILRRIKVSPLPISTHLLSGMAVVFIISLLQAGLLIGFGKMVFNVKINGSPVYIIPTVLIGTGTFVALGFMISSIMKTSKTAILAGNAIATPMMFLSGVFFSIEWAPATIKVIARCLPLYYFGEALRVTMIDAGSFSDVWIDYLVLSAIAIICFSIAVRFFRWE